jgi:SAM-dependent methyltransferase
MAAGGPRARRERATRVKGRRVSFYTSLAEYYERIFPFRPPTFAFLREELGPGGRVLDVGCGSGQYCGRLAADGTAAVGIDPDPRMIARARADFPGAGFVELAMQRVAELTGTFTGAYCIGNVAAHLPPAAWPGFLADLRARLEPGAAWVVQIVNFDPILGLTDYRFPDLELDGGRVVFTRHYRDIGPGRLRFATRLTAGDRILAEGEVTLYPVPAARYLALHEAAGFTPVARFADFTRRTFAAARHSGNVMVFRRSDGTVERPKPRKE